MDVKKTIELLSQKAAQVRKAATIITEARSLIESMDAHCGARVAEVNAANAALHADVARLTTERNDLRAERKALKAEIHALRTAAGEAKTSEVAAADPAQPAP